MNVEGLRLFTNNDLQLLHARFDAKPGTSWSFPEHFFLSIVLYLRGPRVSITVKGRETADSYLDQGQNRLIRFESTKTALRWKSTGKAEFLCINLTAKYFKKIFLGDDHRLIEDCLVEHHGIAIQRPPLNQWAELGDIIYGISRASSRPEPIKKMTLQAKCMELVAVYMERLMLLQSVPETPPRHLKLASLAKQHIDKLAGKKDFTIIGLAKILDTNETTLKQCFKAVFGKTIFRYFQEKRMKLAVKSLRSGKTVSLTSNACGYSNIAHFSTAFKKEYGLPPSEFIHSSL